MSIFVKSLIILSFSLLIALILGNLLQNSMATQTAYLVAFCFGLPLSYLFIEII